MMIKDTNLFMVGYRVYVKCPKCNREQPTQSFGIKSCIFCGYCFTIFPKKGKSRVSRVEGNYQLFLNDVYRYLKKRNKKI